MTNFSFCLLLPCFLFACKSGTSSIAECALSGKYYNRTVLDKCPEQGPADIPHYALELSFEGSDTVIVSNGFEKYPLAYKPVNENCHYAIINAVQGKDLMFRINPDSSILLLDSMWTNVAGGSVFKKSKSQTRADWSFENYLNECMIAGEYFLVGSPDSINAITFLPNGQVMRLRNFLSYQLCIAGDCLEETSERAQTISFTTDRTATETYVLKRSGDGNRYYDFYSLADPVPDVKGNREIKELSFSIRPAADAD